MTSALLTLLALATAAAVEPVTELDAPAYLGRWYQTHASATVAYTFELGGNCVTADYYAVDGYDDVITVANIVRPRLTRPITVAGYGKQDPSIEGAFQVQLGSYATPDAEFTSSDAYWIIGLGPIINGQYQWATVTDASQMTLYVLVRDVADFEANYQASVLHDLEAQGFTTPANKPRVTNQQNCDYDADASEASILQIYAVVAAFYRVVMKVVQMLI